MTIQERENHERNSTMQQEATEQTRVGVDESRRNLAKAGLAATGVLLTLGSRPVLGQWACQTPSGFISGNASPHGTPPMCSGLTQGYWGTRPGNWPSPYAAGTFNKNKQKQAYENWSGGTMFKDFTLGFNCTGFGASFEPYSMMQVILLNGTIDSYQLGAHCVAALLNARSGRTPVLSEEQVRNMFNEYAANGYFEPTAGIKWYPADIVAYLKTTMR